MTFAEIFDGKKPIRWSSWLLGIPYGLWTFLHSPLLNTDGMGVIVIPVGLAIAAEYWSRFIEWAYGHIDGRVF